MIAVSMTVSSVPAARDCASPFEEEDARHESLRNRANALAKRGNKMQNTVWLGVLWVRSLKKIFPTYLRF